MTEEIIMMYGTNWCPDCHRAQKFFKDHNIVYKWINIDLNPEDEILVKQINKGYRSVPTIVFPDGDILVEPSNKELEKKLLDQD